MTEIWQAGPHDAADVTRLIVAFRDWFGGTTPTAATVAESVTVLLADPDTEFLLAGDRERATGLCQLRYRHSVWTGRDDCWLEDLFVDESARRQGLGRALAEAALDRARARGAKRIELDTDADNEAAMALYESLGFSAFSKVPANMRGPSLLMLRRLP